jgi:hypothetical protein
MKRIYLLSSLLLAFGSTAFAQTDMEMVSHSWGNTAATLQPMTSGMTYLVDGDHPKDLYFSWSIKLKSGAALAVGDTVGVLMKSLGTLPYRVVSAVKNVGDTINFTYKTQLTPTASATSGTTNVNWCDSILFKRKGASAFNTDPMPANDKLCNTVAITIWVTGVQNVNAQNGLLTVYPNPASDKLNFKYTFNNATAKVVVRDILGKVVVEKALGNNISGEKEYSLDISNLHSGMYVVELTANDVKSIAKVTVQ